MYVNELRMYVIMWWSVIDVAIAFVLSDGASQFVEKQQDNS